MRKALYQSLKKYLHDEILITRNNKNIVQEKMAETLLMDLRSYADIENGTNMFDTVSFVIYLLEICDDPIKVLDEIKEIFEKVRKNGEE